MKNTFKKFASVFLALLFVLSTMTAMAADTHGDDCCEPANIGPCNHLVLRSIINTSYRANSEDTHIVTDTEDHICVNCGLTISSDVVASYEEYHNLYEDINHLRCFECGYFRYNVDLKK